MIKKTFDTIYTQTEACDFIVTMWKFQKNATVYECAIVIYLWLKTWLKRKLVLYLHRLEQNGSLFVADERERKINQDVRNTDSKIEIYSSGFLGLIIRMIE